ncbi:MAG: ECF-type sigma factor [Pseudomonadota bacterium]
MLGVHRPSYAQRCLRGCGIQTQQVTQLLVQWRDGDLEALNELMPLVYEDLKRVAMNRVQRDSSLAATAIVHEVYTRMVDAQVDWQSRAHFFAISANMIRNILVDHVRSKQRLKRGGDQLAVTLHEDQHLAAASAEDLLVLDRALVELAALDERKVQVIELCYFSGLNQTETAHALDVSVATVERDLKFARAYLNKALSQ